MSKNLMIVHPTPCEDSKFVRQLVNQYGVKETEVHLFGSSKKEEIRKEVSKVKPQLVWLVGKGIRLAANVDVPFKIGYARYTPLFDGWPWGMLIPAKKMVATMPSNIKEEFHARMQAFRQDWLDRNLRKENRGDVRWIRGTAKGFKFKEDQQLKTKKSYWVMYSGNTERHIITLKDKEAKNLWEKEVPFGIKLTQNEMVEITQMKEKDRKLVLDVVSQFGGGDIEIEATG